MTPSERLKNYGNGRDFLKTNPSVNECIETFLLNESGFMYGFVFSGEYANLSKYMIENEEEIKKTIHNIITNRYLKFDKFELLIEIYEAYGNISEYLDKLSKIETPNLKNIKWFKFFLDNSMHDFRELLNYDFEELSKLIEM